MPVSIAWCCSQMPCRRIVLNGSLVEATQIRSIAAHLGIPVIEDAPATSPETGDLWVGICPENGYNGLEGECMEARTIEASIVVSRLRDAVAL